MLWTSPIVILSYLYFYTSPILLFVNLLYYVYYGILLFISLLFYSIAVQPGTRLSFGINKVLMLS